MQPLRRDPGDVADLADAERGEALGRRLADAREEDPRRVQPVRETKSISGETTFAEDLRGFSELRPILWQLCEKVARRLKRRNSRSATCVGARPERVRVRSRKSRSFSFSVTLPAGWRGA
jgi:nucleotidyltransferase/DNA polymerase involved in DNA repair